MRVLTVGNMYPPHHLGGYELMWRSAVGHLREWGHDVRVLTTDYRADAADPSLPEDEGVARELRWYWRDHEFPRVGPRARIALERHNAAVFERELDDFQPEVVNWWAMGGMSLSLIERCRQAGLPAASVVVDDWLTYGPKVDAWQRLSRRLGPIAGLTGLPTGLRLEESALWLFASETIRDRAAAAGFDTAGSRVAYPGIDHDLYRDPPPRDGNWSGRLLYLGRIDERKGIDVAVEALAELPDARLRVVGGGDDAYLEQLHGLVDRLGVGDRISFERLPGSELPRAYADADVTLFPVRWEEPFGLVPLESMAMGTPVIASGRGGSGEYLEDGQNCLLVDVDRGGVELAAAIGRLAGDSELRGRLREHGLATASRFSAESFDRAVEDALGAALRDVR